MGRNMGEYGDYEASERRQPPLPRRPLPYGPNEYRNEIARVQQSRKRTALLIAVIVLVILIAAAVVSLLGIRLPF